MALRGERRQESGDRVSEAREWRPVISRKCTDPLWLFFFFLFWAGLMFVTGYAVMAGAAERLVLGYDSFGNICGRKNVPVKGVPLSGKDMTSKNKSFPLFNRCVPQHPECYSKYASVLINTVNQMDVFHRILSGILAGRDTVIGLSVLALVVSGVLWWLYYDYRNDPSTELETEKENVKFLFGYAIFSTVVTLSWRQHSVSEQYFIDNCCNYLDWYSSIRIDLDTLEIVEEVLCRESTAQTTSEGQVEYRAFTGICYMAWYHFVGLIWTSEFILACQQMTIAGAVVTCYFNRNKNNPPRHPVLSSISVLLCYHLGTVVKGSFLITILRIPRIVFLYLYSILKQKHVYTTTAINGTNFCTSAKDAVFILAKSSAELASVSCFGDFIVFLGKVFVVCFTVFGGLMAFNYHRELQAWVVPLLLVGFFAYLMSHSFLSVFEVTLDTMFLCFAIDMETNDGSAERPYFVDQELLMFVNQNNKSTDRQKHRSMRRDSEDGTELQPMVRQECGLGT
ncbi:hypothetical protein ASZ78_012988 [Callipepla squamata]|uniref:Choline transporter-like protein n=1 Tax=Callipepla squamata TaxID=9009 RepID=A0A226NG01_CALSU|nr:hypothetical protein ASZ78_012988 [Callipepla squamata]